MAIGILLFLPAGTFHYWKAWLLMGILFIPMLFAGIVLLLKNPDLLKKRLNTKESQAEQRLVINLSAAMFLLGFVLAGLNFRFGWIIAPDWLSWTGTAIFLLSYMLYAEGSKIQNHSVSVVSTDFTVLSLLGKIEYIVLYVNR